MSSKDRNRRRQKRRAVKRKQAKNQRRVTGAVPSVVDLALQRAAPAIEAAGSLQRAVELGFVMCSQAALHALADRIPVSRGGNLQGDDVEAEWLRIVEQNVRARNVDMEAMRRSAQAWEKKSLS